MKKILALSAVLALSAGMAHAQSIVLGAGFADFSDRDSDDHALVALEYQHRPFHQATRFSVGWGAALSIDEAGDTHIGAGLVGLYSLNDRWFLEGSVLPGYFSEADELNDEVVLNLSRKVGGCGQLLPWTTDVEPPLGDAKKERHAVEGSWRLISSHNYDK